jgi:hypothetical protein
MDRYSFVAVDRHCPALTGDPSYADAVLDRPVHDAHRTDIQALQCRVNCRANHPSGLGFMAIKQEFITIFGRAA